MTGSRAALPIWIELMEAYLASARGKDDRAPFAVPEGVTFVPVDRFNGCLPSARTRSVVREAFLDGAAPDERCLPYPPRLGDLPWPMQWAVYAPRPGEPEPTAAAVTVADGRLGAEP
jgi:membrane carboxypeptidase/penicillin-binding protein